MLCHCPRQRKVGGFEHVPTTYFYSMFRRSSDVPPTPSEADNFRSACSCPHMFGSFTHGPTPCAKAATKDVDAGSIANLSRYAPLCYASRRLCLNATVSDYGVPKGCRQQGCTPRHHPILRDRRRRCTCGTPLMLAMQHLGSVEASASTVDLSSRSWSGPEGLDLTRMELWKRV